MKDKKLPKSWFKYFDEWNLIGGLLSIIKRYNFNGGLTNRDRGVFNYFIKLFFSPVYLILM